MLRVKAGVNLEGVAPEIWYAIGYASALHAGLSTADLVITSAHDGEHKEGSLHYVGKAVDLRTHDLGAAAKLNWFRLLGRALNPLGFDVILERDPEHLHIEFDPKPGECFTLPELLPPAQPAKA